MNDNPAQFRAENSDDTQALIAACNQGDRHMREHIMQLSARSSAQTQETKQTISLRRSEKKE